LKVSVSVLFANICASKTFFAQERTIATFGTSTRLNFMPLRADESKNTHPISRQKISYTHTHTHTHYFPLVDEIKKGASEIDKRKGVCNECRNDFDSSSNLRTLH